MGRGAGDTGASRSSSSRAYREREGPGIRRSGGELSFFLLFFFTLVVFGIRLSWNFMWDPFCSFRTNCKCPTLQHTANTICRSQCVPHDGFLVPVVFICSIYYQVYDVLRNSTFSLIFFWIVFLDFPCPPLPPRCSVSKGMRGQMI